MTVATCMGWPEVIDHAIRMGLGFVIMVLVLYGFYRFIMKAMGD